MTQQQLPIIDVAAFVADVIAELHPDTPTLAPSSSDRKTAKDTAARLMDHACREFGFFYLTGHGIPEDILRDIQTHARAFFAQPQEAKDRIAITTTDLSRGYQRLGLNVTQYQNDWHEAIDLYRDAHDVPALLAHDTKCLKGCNPPISHPNTFQPLIDDYVRRCLLVGRATMRCMAMALGLQERFFDDLNSDSFWVLRIIGYPQLQRSSSKDNNDNGMDGGISCGEHTDYGCLTLLLQDETKGALQVLTKTNEWLPIDPIPNVFVVNIGDMVNVWTNGVYTSTLHRVIHTQSNYRVSVPFFYEPNFDTVVRPLPSCVAESGGVPRYDEVVYGEHLIRKVSTNFAVPAAPEQ